MNLQSIANKTTGKAGKGLYGVPHIVWAIVCLVYVISPFDLLPEVILGPLGIVDDAGIAVFGVMSLMRWIKSRRAHPVEPATRID